PPRPGPIKRAVAHDREQPGLRIPTAVLVEGAERPQKRFLDDVICCNGVARDEPRQTVGRIQMRQEKVLELTAQASPIRRAWHPPCVHGSKTARPACLFPI